MDDEAFDWAATRLDEDAMANGLITTNGGGTVCKMCGALIRADHPLVCSGTARPGTMRGYTHDAVLHALGKAAKRLHLPCKIDCGARGNGGDLKPDLCIEDLKMELKTTVPSAHDDPTAEMRRVVRDARGKYANKGWPNALVIAVTTRGILSPDSTDDLAALQQKFAEEAWRPTPTTDVVIGVALAKSNAARWALWAQRARTPTSP